MNTLTRFNLRVAWVAMILLPAFGATVEPRPLNRQTDGDISHIRELLLRDAWVHNVRQGRIAIESIVLMFREKDEVNERIYDDTGGHDASGTWQLEESGGKIILVLTGNNLRNRGRFALNPDPKGDWIELRPVDGETVVRCQRQKGYRCCP